jgi:hypothetical protein
MNAVVFKRKIPFWINQEYATPLRKKESEYKWGDPVVLYAKT